MRKRLGLFTFVVGLALLMLAAGAPAFADPAGNNGTVKIHDGDSESEPIRANEPHVGCSFHIHGFNFDGGASGTWRIEPWPPGASSGPTSGTWGMADKDGNWRTPVMSLQSGHYKLFVDQTQPNNPPGGSKQKVFWVECGGQQPATTGGNQGSNQGNNAGGNSGGNAGGNVGNNAAGGNGGGAPQNENAGAQPVVGGVITPPTNNQQAAAQPQVQASRAVAGVQGGVQTLPSTSTDPNTPAAALGLLLVGSGAYLLRRPRRRVG